MAKKTILLIITFFLFFSLKIHSNEINYLNSYSNSKETNLNKANLVLVSFTIPISNKFNNNNFFKTPKTSGQPAYGFNLIVPAINCTIVGVISTIVGIPLLAVGACYFSQPEIQNYPNSDAYILYRNLIISGGVCLGSGLLLFIPLIICVILLNY